MWPISSSLASVCETPDVAGDRCARDQREDGTDQRDGGQHYDGGDDPRDGVVGQHIAIATVVAIVIAQYIATPTLTCCVSENNRPPISKIVTAVNSSAISL